MAATKNGHSSAYLRGDTDLDRTVDLADYNALATNFDPSGAYGPYLWQDGNSDGDCGQSGKQFPARCLLESIRELPFT